ncbi:MAG: hypothetical protein QOE11_3070 [Solirubrobacteraceae bacterium]|jgi:hypothetical protein|nr:hypothetical protein [Solirubrobacteraceae bacterium]
MRRQSPTIIAVLVLMCLQALSGCGGSSSKPATTTTATAAVAEKPLDQSQRDRVDRVDQRVISSASLFLSKINRCAARKRRKACVKSAIAPAERAVRNARATLVALKAAAGGQCADALSTVKDKITDVTDVLGPMAQATQTGDVAVSTRLGANAQTELRSFAALSLSAQTVCTG